MGKLVKYCDNCEESFAEKFSFCPNCAAPLEKFEMKPVAADKTNEANKAVADEPRSIENTPFAEVPETPAPVEAAPIAEETQFQSEPFAPAATFSADDFTDDDDVLEIDVENNEPQIFSQPVESQPVETVEAAPIVAPDVVPDPYAASPFATKVYAAPQMETKPADGGFASAGDYDSSFHVTVIEEKNVKQRNWLLLGSFVLLMTVLLAGVIYSIFEKDLDLAALDDGSIGALIPLIDEDPMQTVEEEKKQEKDNGGGGGGGGREEERETSKGRLANQMPDPPLISPTKTIEQKDFDLKYQATTQGNRQFQQTNEKYGDPNSKSDFPSDGTGSGGGQGSGIGTGQGSGRGAGQGSGIGTGSGGGIGNGNGGGTGAGGGNPPPPPPPPPKPVGVSSPLQITFKPKPRYTDAARQNNVTGSVTVRVTFLASGQIGSVTPVSSLGYGLTEQAIAAAKSMKFQPQKVNGEAVSVTKSVVFSFSIY